MKSKYLILTVSLLFSALGFSQTSNPNIINKDIPVRTGTDIFDVPTNNRVIQSALNSSKANNEIFVYFENKFYPSDTIQKIKNLDDYELNVIKIPKNVSKDIQGIIFLRKKAVK